MRGITLGVVNNMTIYDVDFQTNVLDVSQTMGYDMPPYSTRLLLNKLMVDMKNIGFYQIQDTLANFALGITGFEQFRMIDWKLTGNIYTPYRGLIYNSNGIEGNGVDAYVDTNFNPAIMGVNYTLDYASRGFVLSKQGATNPSAGSIDGIESSGLLNNSYCYNRNSQRINQGSDTGNGSINLLGLGYANISRVSSMHVNGFLGAETQVVEASSVSVVSANQLILNRGGNFGTSGLSLYHMGAAILFSISQSFRTIYNQFLSDSGLSPIA